MAITLKRLYQLINKEFGPPFLKDGHVVAKLYKAGKQSLSIQIGRRDIEIDSDGNVLGGGTCLCKR